MPDLHLLGSLMMDLHQEFVRLYYLLLPVFFALAVVVAWFRSPQGSPEFLDILKRTVISTLLLTAFPDISRAIIFVADGIADRINGLSTIDMLIRMAKEKSENYSLTPTSIILQFNDLLLATLSFLSFLILYIARYLTIAMYHFFWIFFMVTAPLLLLFNLFQSTSVITVNLFKGMIEVACWKIVWAILGAMLAAISFGDAYQTDGNYLTLIVMNFVIAVAMLCTPMIVRSLVGSGFQSMSSTFAASTVAAMAAAPARVGTLASMGRNELSMNRAFAMRGIEKLKGNSTQANRKDIHNG